MSDTPDTNSHSILRWMSRGKGALEKRLDEAWDEATEVEVEKRNYDEARYHEAENVILIYRDGTIKTVLNAEYEEYEIKEDDEKCITCGTQQEPRKLCMACGTSL